jgi:predicted ATPase
LRVVITGGPCAGKTELWHFLGSRFPQAAQVAEAATELILAGEAPEQVGLEAFQRKVYQIHSLREEEALRRSPFLLCDRGLPDGLAYLPDLPRILGIDLEELLQRYDLVLQLAVIPDGETYRRHAHANPARREDHAFALTLEDRLARIYGAHPGYLRLGGTLEEKMREAVRILLEALAKR